VQEYVFESARLPEIRGGSFLLSRLNRKEPNCKEEETGRKESEDYKPITALIRELDNSAEIIYAGGGSVLAEVDVNKAELIRDAIEKRYPERTGLATITCVFQPVPGNAKDGYPNLLSREAINRVMTSDNLTEYQRWRILTQYGYTPEKLKKQQHLELDEEHYVAAHNFGEWVRLLGVRLRRRKQEKDHLPFVEAPPYTKRCRSCRKRPAARVKSEFGELWARCPACQEKAMHTDRSVWRDKFVAQLHCYQKGSDKKKQERANRYFAEFDKPIMPASIKEIATAGQPRNRNKQDYVAYIYADGDGVGTFVERQRSRQEYKRNSELFAKATWKALVHALVENLHVVKQYDPNTKREQPTHPFEIITVGGDDILLIVPAPSALPVAVNLGIEFTTFLNREADKIASTNTEWADELRKLTLSVGLVIAPSHTPVRLLHEMAKELLKSAKRRAKSLRKEKKYTAAIDFQVLTSTAVFGAKVADMRRYPPYLICREDNLSLMHRPYTLDEARRILEALTKLNEANFPPSQLHGLASALERGRHWSTLYYLYQRARMREYRLAFDALEQIIPPTVQNPMPWYRLPTSSDADFNTTIRDVAELYDFVREKEGTE